MSSPVTAQLILINGESGNFRFPNTINLKFPKHSIGRGQACDTLWGSVQVSRQHATFEFMSNKWYIRDTSTNGITVHGIKLRKGVLFPLNHDEIINFMPNAAVRYQFVHVPAPSRPTTQPSSSESTSRNGPSRIIRSNTPGPGLHFHEIDSDDSDDSDSSGSLLSLDGPEEYHSCNTEDNTQAPGADTSPAKTSSAPLVSKRKNIAASSSATTNNNVDPKKRRVQPLSSSDDDSDDDSDDQVPGPSSDKKTNPQPSGMMTDDQISQCEDIEMLKRHLKEVMTNLKSTEVHLQMMEVERSIEREDFRKKERDQTLSISVAVKEEIQTKILAVMESELNCSVCNEVFIQSTVIDCGHTFCEFCINEWALKKLECPICRKSFRNRSRHFEMENLIRRMYDSFSEDVVDRRKILIRDREEEVETAAETAAASRNQAPGHIEDLMQQLLERNIVARQNGRGGNNNARATNAERRRSARIRDRETVENPEVQGTPGDAPAAVARFGQVDPAAVAHFQQAARAVVAPQVARSAVPPAPQVARSAVPPASQVARSAVPPASQVARSAVPPAPQVARSAIPPAPQVARSAVQPAPQVPRAGTGTSSPPEDLDRPLPTVYANENRNIEEVRPNMDHNPAGEGTILFRLNRILDFLRGLPYPLPQNLMNNFNGNANPGNNPN